MREAHCDIEVDEEQNDNALLVLFCVGRWHALG